MARQRRPWRRRTPLLAAGAAALAAIAAGGALHKMDRSDAIPEPTLTEISTAEPTTFADAFAAGILELRRGDAHAAARAFEAARRINPHAAEVYVNLGYAYLELGKVAEAATLLNRATEIKPDLVNAYFGLAEALDASGDATGARGAMRVFLHRATPDHPFRRRAMSALWEWERDPARPSNAALTSSPPDTAEQRYPLFGARVTNLDGTPVDLNFLRGKTLIVNVWASWCGPCRAELPSLDQLAAKLDPKAFAVVGLSIDRERAFTREFLREIGVTFPTYWAGEDGLDGGPFEARALPLTIILDSAGRLLARHEGARDWSAPSLVAALEALGPVATLDAVALVREVLK